ncbi:hypothetical protein IJ182_00140 [bacterium]|nr:hypothetical protein [bacterium]
MELEGICFDKNKSFSGAFQLPNGNTYFGKFFYKKNEQCEFYIYMNGLSIEEREFNEIKAQLSDENENIFCVNFFNCEIEPKSFSSVWDVFCGYFDYALFSRYRYFDSNTEDINKKVNIFINTWAEFCFPQGYKHHAAFEPKLFEFKLKNKMKISFNQGIKGYLIAENHIFDNLFINRGLSKKEINIIEKQLNNILIPYKNNIGIKNTEKHKWYIQIENIPKNIDIDIIDYSLTLMLICFTYDFGSKIDKIEIVSKDILNNATLPAIFDYLYYMNIITKEPKYKYKQSAFNINTFSKQEWQIILNNLFSKSKILMPFFDILYQNNYERNLSEYHLERYIDCISAIGINKNYGRMDKYEKVLQNFVNNLDKDTQKKLLNQFRRSLKNIKAGNPKNNKKRNWGLIGKKLSELRAMTTHFNDSSKRINMSKFFSIYFIIELIVIDYIFEILGIDEQKRIDYKEFYLKKIPYTS